MLHLSEASERYNLSGKRGSPDNSSERGGALVSDAVIIETASEGQGGNSGRATVSMGIDTKANTRAAAPQVGDLRLLEDGDERGGALGPDVVEPKTADGGRSGDGERVARMSTGTDTKANTWGGRRT